MNKNTLAAIIAILIMTTLLYFNGLTPSFSSDDYIHLDKNKNFGTLWDTREVFLHLDGREYRPLVRLSLWLNYKMGTTALPFHITNLLLHLTCIVSLYFLFLKLSGSPGGSLVGCALFALHPIHTTNVHFIMGRTGMLCALFCFLALLAFLEADERRSARLDMISLGFFIFALLSKEEAVSLPLLVLFVALLHPDSRFRKPLKRSFPRIAAFFIILAAYLAVRFFYLSGNYDQIAVYTNFKVAHILINYMKWVVGLSYPFDFYHARWAVETGRYTAIIAPIAIVGTITAGLVYCIWPVRKALIRNRLVVLSLIWFVVTLMPISGGDAHRWYLYMPSAGLCLLAVAIYVQKFTVAYKRMLTVLIGMAAVCYGAEVYRQSEIWSRQSRISADFLEQAGALGLYELDGLYFINMPFGYRSAFLFTFNSFENALAIQYGKRPKIRILSHVNLDSETHMTVSTNSHALAFSMPPTANAYFIFSQLQRRFSSKHYSFDRGPFHIRTNQLSTGGTIASYTVEFSGRPQWPVYYFDGQKIHKR